jgi:hypothetical protein
MPGGTAFQVLQFMEGSYIIVMTVEIEDDDGTYYGESYPQGRTMHVLTTIVRFMLAVRRRTACSCIFGFAVYAGVSVEARRYRR